MNAVMNGAKDTAPALLDEKPVFDFSRSSYKDARVFGRLQLEINHLNKRIMSAGADTDITALLDELDAMGDRQEQHIMKVVVSVPRAWMIEGAPDTVNWQDNAALRWLRSDKFLILLDAITEAQNAKN